MDNSDKVYINKAYKLLLGTYVEDDWQGSYVHNLTTPKDMFIT